MKEGGEREETDGIFVAGSSGQLLKDLKALVMVLNHFESTSTITSMAFKNPQVPRINTYM